MIINQYRKEATKTNILVATTENMLEIGETQHTAHGLMGWRACRSARFVVEERSRNSD